MSFSKSFSSFSTANSTANLLVKSTAVLALFAGIFSFGFNLPVKASTYTWSKYMIVTEPKGINIRNRSCEVIDSLGFGQIVQRYGNGVPVSENLNCKVNNKDLIMIKYVSINGGNYDLDNAYVALEYVDSIIDSSSFNDASRKFDINKSSVITGEYGANLRDSASCSRVMTVPNGTKMEANSAAPSLAVCQVGSEFYLMRQPIYQGKAYFVADILIDNI